MKTMLMVLLLLVAVLNGGAFAASEKGPVRLLEANHQAVERLIASIPPSRPLSKQKPIIVTTVVNVDDLSGSRLGRVLAEQLGTKMTSLGYAVIELKMREKIFVKQGEGELMLSREVKDLSRSQMAQAVLVGTYAESGGGMYPGGGGCVYVTLKLVNAADNTVVAAHDYVLPLDGNIRSLLHPAGNNGSHAYQVP